MNSAIALLDPTDSAFITGRDEQGLVRDTAPLLGSLRDELARGLGDPRYLLDTAVLTVPATFDAKHIEATRQAAQVAGFEVLELLPEPDAVAVYQSWVESHSGPPLDEPDLCAACGAALRAASHGTRYVGLPGDVELHLISSPHTQDGTEPDRPYQITGTVGGSGGAALLDGGSVRARSFVTGLAGEAFLDARGAFALDMELEPDTENALEVAILDPAGDEIACIPVLVRHRSPGRPLGPAPPPKEPPTGDRPPLAQLVRRCLELAADLADATGRNREELFEFVYAQERYAEQARGENNQRQYRECTDNLGAYAGYLEQLLRDALPRPPRGPVRSPEEEARDGLERFRAALADVWKKVRAAGRSDLDGRLAGVARRAQGLAQRARTAAPAALQEIRSLLDEIDQVAEQLQGGPAPPADGDVGAP